MHAHTNTPHTHMRTHTQTQTHHTQTQTHRHTQTRGHTHAHTHTTLFRLMSRVHEEHKEAADSSDDELQFVSKPQASVGSEGCSKSWYHRLLQQHNRKLRNGNTELDATKGITLDDIVRRDQAIKDGWDDEVTLPSRQRRRVTAHSHRPPPAAGNGAVEQVDSSGLDESDLVPAGQNERMFPSLSVRECRKFVGVKADTPVE